MKLQDSKVILFADIAGSTALYEAAGNETAHQMVSACIARLQDVTKSQNGRNIKTIGDELMCCFDTVDQALLAASAMQFASRDLQTLKIRIGFHYGEFVEANGDVFGDTVNLAARIVGLANPNQILTTLDTYKCISPSLKASCRKLHSTFVKGRSEKVTLFEVIWAVDDGLTAIVNNNTLQTKTNPSLLVTFKDQTWELNENSSVLEIGRGVSQGLLVDIQSASRYHASIGIKNKRFVLSDHSSNGTYVRLENRDELVLRREEIILTGVGQIGLGCAIADCNDSAIHFELG